MTADSSAIDADADAAIRAAIAHARRLTETEPEPFRSVAFQVVLTHLLAGATAPAPSRAAAPPLTDMDLAEFLVTRKVTTHPDRVVAIAYFTYHTEHGSGVTTHDLTEAYSRARVKKPQNFPDVIAACVRKGRLVEGERKDGMKAWVITRTGEAFIEGSL